jgi:hypothetical protein
MLWLIIEY